MLIFGLGATVGAALLAALGASQFGDGSGLGEAKAAARLTARFSFTLFVLAWTASSLARLWPAIGRPLLARRRALGVAFAAAHLVHLGTIAWVVLGEGAPVKPLSALGGGLAYLFTVLMLVTSNDAAVRALGGRRWRWLHRIGGWIILAIFALTYAKRWGPDPLVAASGLAVVALALALRSAAGWRARGAG